MKLSIGNGQETVIAVPTSGSGGQTALFPTSENAPASVHGKVTAKNLVKLLDVQGKRCALTGAALTPETVSLDHIQSIAEGGADDMSNVQLVHATINAMKGTMGQDEFVRWCRLVAEHSHG